MNVNRFIQNVYHMNIWIEWQTVHYYYVYFQHAMCSYWIAKMIENWKNTTIMLSVCVSKCGILFWFIGPIASNNHN